MITAELCDFPLPRQSPIVFRLAVAENLTSVIDYSDCYLWSYTSQCGQDGMTSFSDAPAADLSRHLSSAEV